MIDCPCFRVEMLAIQLDTYTASKIATHKKIRWVPKHLTDLSFEMIVQFSVLFIKCSFYNNITVDPV